MFCQLMTETFKTMKSVHLHLFFISLTGLPPSYLSNVFLVTVASYATAAITFPSQ